MARPRSEKTRPKAKPVQAPLPEMPAPDPSRTTRVLPMLLQVGDGPRDETGGYEIIGRPCTTNAGKDVRARVKRVDNAEVD